MYFTDVTTGLLDEPLLVAVTGVGSTRLQGKIKDACDLYECAIRWEIAVLPSLNVGMKQKSLRGPYRVSRTVHSRRFEDGIFQAVMQLREGSTKEPRVAGSGRANSLQIRRFNEQS